MVSGFDWVWLADAGLQVGLGGWCWDLDGSGSRVGPGRGGQGSEFTVQGAGFRV